MGGVTFLAPNLLPLCLGEMNGLIHQGSPHKELSQYLLTLVFIHLYQLKMAVILMSKIDGDFWHCNNQQRGLIVFEIMLPHLHYYSVIQDKFNVLTYVLLKTWIKTFQSLLLNELTEKLRYYFLKELNWEIGMHISLTWLGCVIWRVCLWKTKQWLYIYI